MEIEIRELNERLDGLVKNGTEAIDRAVNYTTQHLEARLKINAPKDHGRLAGSFQTDKQDDLTYVVFSNVRYALLVNDGTGIYGPTGQPITPVNSKYLVFSIGGQTIFTKEVKGQRPNPYIDTSLEETKSRLQEFIDRAISEIK